MIELTWGQIRDHELSLALNSLARQRVPYATTLKLLTISKEIEAQQKKAQSMAEIIRDKYMAQDPETKMYKLKDGADEEALKNEEKEFIDTKFKIRVGKLKSGDLASTQLTTVELFKLESLVEFEGEERPTSHLKPVEGNA
jgi:hypothetical protein